MGREEVTIQEEIAGFVCSMKDTSAMLHSKPRFLYHKAWLDMEFWNQRNYIELFYASDYVEVGNEYDWANSRQIKVDIEFNGWWAYMVVSGITYDEASLPILDAFIKENNLKIIEPNKKEEETTDEEAAIKAMLSGGMSSRSSRDIFVIDSFLIYDPNKIKDAIMAIDNQLNNYSFEGMI